MQTQISHWPFRIFWTFIVLLTFAIAFLSQANMQADPVDYYTNLQKIVANEDQPLMPNSHFADQRSPGYSLLSVPMYYTLQYLISPLGNTILDPNGMKLLLLPPGPTAPGQQDTSSERPERREFVSVKDMFFTDFDLREPSGTIRWTLFGALILTSFVFLYIGIFALRSTLKLIDNRRKWLLLIPVIIIGSPFILFNIFLSPAYPTLTSFGMSALFAYFFVKGFDRETSWLPFWAGLCAGTMVLIRLEASVFVIALMLMLTLQKKWQFLLRFIGGGLITVGVLALYNMALYGTPIHLEILRGDINKMVLNAPYLFDALLHPASGILYWSFFVVVGLIGLFVGRNRMLQTLGIASIALLLLYCLKVPVMYLCVGQGVEDLGNGILLGCLPNATAARGLVQNDMNRYIVVLAPFAVLGLQQLLLWKAHRKKKNA